MSYIYEFTSKAAARNHLITIEADDEADACQQFAAWVEAPDYVTARATWGSPAFQVTAERFYGAQLKAVDVDAQRTEVNLADGQVREFLTATDFHKPGQYGTLTIKNDGSFTFWAYIEQRLRLLPANHQHAAVIGSETVQAWDWVLDGVAPGARGSLEDPIITKRFFVPGADGKFIQDLSRKLALDIPQEFIELCEDRDMTPEQVLRGFIADVCGLMNYVAEPREDGYSSNGSDERSMAHDWFNRAYFN